MIEQKIGKRIQQCRKKKGYTQDQLAEKVKAERVEPNMPKMK